MTTPGWCGRLVCCGVALVAALSACDSGQLEAGVAPAAADDVFYPDSGEIAAFHGRDLVTYTGDLGAETGRMTFDTPSGAKIIAHRLSADGHVAVIAWSASAQWATYPANGVSTALTVEAFRLPDRQRLLSLALPNLEALELSPTGDRLAISIPGYNQPPPLRGFEVYSVDGGALLWSSLDVLEPFVFSPDGAQIYANVLSAGSLGCWSAATGDVRYLMPIDASRSYYLALAVSSDGQELIGSGFAAPPALGFPRFDYWSAGDGRFDRALAQVDGFEGASALVIAPDGGHWAAFTLNLHARHPDMIQMRDSTGTVLYTLPSRFAWWPFFARPLAFSPDSQSFVVTPGAGSSASLSLYRVADGAPIAVRSLPSDAP